MYQPNKGDAGAKVISGWGSKGFDKSPDNKLAYHIDEDLSNAPDRDSQNADRSERVFQRIDPKVLGGAVGTDLTDAELWRKLKSSAQGMKSGFFYLALDLKESTTNSSATWATVAKSAGLDPGQIMPKDLDAGDFPGFHTDLNSLDPTSLRSGSRNWAAKAAGARWSLPLIRTDHPFRVATTDRRRRTRAPHPWKQIEARRALFRGIHDPLRRRQSSVLPTSFRQEGRPGDPSTFSIPQALSRRRSHFVFRP